MKLDDKLRYAVLLEMILAAIVLMLILTLPDKKVSGYRLWEVLPAILATIITTFGLKEMRKRT